MLIVQLDAYIFGTSDELKQFVALGKPYIGAPWKREYAATLDIPTETAGNGGVSLRKIQTMIDILQPNADVKRNERLKTVEDQYITYILYNRDETVTTDVAMRFAIDNDPEYWHERNGKRVPWAVHMGKPEWTGYWRHCAGVPFLERTTAQHRLLKQRLQPTERIIVSLTSFSDRLKNDAPQVIKEILTLQTIKPDLVVLSVYKDDEPLIPDSIRKLANDDKVEIIVSDKNYRPHLKYYPAMKKYKDAVIITVDDDQHYYNRMIEDLYETHVDYPNTVCACRCHRMTYHQDGRPKKYDEWIFQCKEKAVPSFDLFATGVGGVLYPPNILDIDNVSESDIYDYITTDDILLKILENERGVRVVGTMNHKMLRTFTSPSSKKDMLCSVNTTGQKINDINIAKGRLVRHEETMKKICYTCITGNYDTLNEPKVVTPGWRYICFTDNMNLRSNVWEIMPLPDAIAQDGSLSTVKKQRMMKIRPYAFFDYDVCVWVDGNLLIKGNLDDLYDTFRNDEIAITKHPKRDCIYDEAEAIVKYRKDTWNNLTPQLDFYKTEYFPHHYGLHETNVIWRKNTPTVQRVMDMWAQMVKKYSHRDQMSLSYVLWKLSVSIKAFEP